MELLIIIFIHIISLITMNKFCQSADPRNTAMVMSVKTQAGKPYMKYIEGNPDVWVEIIKKGGSQSIKDIAKTDSLDTFNKLASCYNQRRLVWSNSYGREIEYGQLVLFSSSFTGTIRRAHYDSSPELGGMTVDWSTNNLYWTDQLYNWILMAPLDDRRIFHIVVNDGLDKPGGIVVHPGRSYLFWTDYGSRNPKIERSDLLGKNRQTIVSSGLVRPVAMEIDVSQDQLYWVDPGTRLIETSKLDGSQRRGILQQSFVSSVVGISLFKSHMFAVSSNSYLHLINITSPTSPESVSLQRIYKTMYDVTTFSEVTQPNITSPCSNAGCKSMCVGTHGNSRVQCVCPWNMELMQDGTTCTVSQYRAPPLYLYTSSPGKVCWYYVWAPDMVNNPLQINCDYQLNNRTTNGMGYLLNKNHAFVGSGTSIQMLVLKSGTSFQNFISNAGHVQAISVNWITEEIFWTTADGFIKKSTTNPSGASSNIVMSSETGIGGIVVEPFSRQMIWTINGPNACIKKAHLDGSSSYKLVSADLIQPEALVIDYKEYRLYWTDSLKHTLESINMDGTNRKLVVNVVGSQPYGIAIFEEYIAWTDKKPAFPSVQWYYKNGSGFVKSQRQNSIPGSIVLYGEYNQPQNYSVPDTEVVHTSTMSTTSLQGGGDGNLPFSTSTKQTIGQDSSGSSVNLVIIISAVVAAVFVIVLFTAVFLLIYCICVRRRTTFNKSPEQPEPPVLYTTSMEGKIITPDYTRLSRQRSQNEYYTDAISTKQPNGYPEEEIYDTIDEKHIGGTIKDDYISPKHTIGDKNVDSTEENGYVIPKQTQQGEPQEENINDSEKPFYLTTESLRQSVA